MLKIKELPYFLTLLFSLLGVSVKYLSDKIQSSSFIEYELKYCDTDSLKYYDCIIENVSADKTYRSLFFSIYIKDTINGSFTNAFIIPYPPVFQANFIVNGEQLGKAYANFIVTELIPGSKYKLRIGYTGEITPQFIFKAEQSGKNNPPYYFKESSIITKIAKNEFGIIFSFIFLWFILIVIYMYKIKIK